MIRDSHRGFQGVVLTAWGNRASALGKARLWKRKNSGQWLRRAGQELTTMVHGSVAVGLFYMFIVA